MRRIALVASLITLVFATACGPGAEENTVATPPSDYTDESPAAGDAKISDHGTKTFTTEEFDVEVEMDNEEGDFYFEPTFIKAPGESTATVELHNEGDIQHTFTIDDLDVDEELAPEESQTITVELGTETRYEYYCRFHGSEGMRGAFQPH